jgi:DNA-binding SARP family transcriptional activator
VNPLASDEETAALSLSDEGAFVKSTWEVTWTDPNGFVRHFPVYRTVLKVPPVHFTMLKGQLHFESAQEMMHRREPVTKGVLGVGETLAWAGGVLTLHDRSGKSRATMECFTDPFYSRTWTLDQKLIRVGRPGKRKNEMEIDHPTISREHAVLSWEAPGPVLRSKGVTVVDGVSASEVVLTDGALVQLGDLLFQFRLLSELAAPRGGLEVTSLGSFQVRVHGELITEKAWRTQAVRWMLARLALEWGRPVAVERLLDEFWPEMPEDKSRNNFNYTISTLRQVLGGSEAILRATGSLQLAPGFLGVHDLVALQRALRAEDWATAVDLYGEYLPGCYMDWAVTVRGHLEQQTLQGGLRLLERHEKESRWAELTGLGRKLHTLDPTCQRTCTSLLRAHLGLGNPAEGVRAYERFREQLRSELALEPAGELVALYERAKAAAGPVPRSGPG